MSKFAALALAVETPERMPVLHPVTKVPLVDGTGKEAHIALFSSDSPQAQEHLRSLSRKRIASKNRTVLTIEEVERGQIDGLVKLTAGWYLVGLDGMALDVPFSPENARELYAEPAMAWLREQVEQFAADRENFLKASSKN